MTAPATRPEKGEIRRPAVSGKSSYALVALLGMSFLTRIPAVHNTPLWIDELWRAVLILDPKFWHAYFLSPTVETAITSPIYAALIKMLATIGISPDLLRLSSLVPGILCPLAAFALIRKVGGSVMLAFLAGAFFAFNPNFISYSSEMKPYMFEVFLHLACLYAWLAVLLALAPTRRDWVLCLAILVLAILSSPTTIFVLPAIGLSLFVRHLLERDWKNLRICVLGFAGLGALVLALYHFIWRYGASDEMLTIWASGFRQPGASYAGFLASQFSAMWNSAFQTLIAAPHQSLLAFGAAIAALAWLVATGKIRHRPVRDFVLLYATLLVTLCLINFLLLWPLGAGRENLFLFGHLIIFLFVILAQLPLARLAAPVAVICISLFLVWHARSGNGRAQYRALAAHLTELGAPVERSDLVVEDFSYLGPVGKGISAQCPRNQATVVLNGYMASAVSYYTEFDSAHRGGAALLKSHCVNLVVYGGEAYQGPDKAAAFLAPILTKIPEAWFVYTHLGEPETAALRGVAQRFGRITQSTTYRGAGYFKLVMTPPRK